MKHLTKFVLVYPLGQLPPDVKPEDVPDDEPIGQFEDSVFQFSDHPPATGAVHEMNQNRWTVNQVHTYQVLHSTPGATQSVHVAVCGQNGETPQQQAWHNNKPPILYIPALVGGKLALNEDGTYHFGLAEETPLNIPLNDIFEDWEVRYSQTFEPTSWYSAAYSQIVICWCKEPALVAAA